MKDRAAPAQARKDLAPAAAAPALSNGLVYVHDGLPGLRRVRRGGGFGYQDSEGRWLRDRNELERIRRLAIPPAYTDVWICPHAEGHLQATGRDARGRKQYRYHAAWRVQQDGDKFDRLLDFGRVLPRIRARVARDLRPPGSTAPTPTRTMVLATLVRLLDTTWMRVGNTAYARTNRSFGLTTLHNRHADVGARQVRLRFRGKSGVLHDVTVDDPSVTRVVRRCQQLPGQELFVYIDDDGSPRTVGSTDVNDYLAEAAGQRVTAKDFRTWHGSVLALDFLCHGDESRGPGKAQEVAMVRAVAQRLGNTVAVCRKAYIHPAVLALAGGQPDERPNLAFDLAELDVGPDRERSPRGLKRAERRLLRLLTGLSAP